MGWIKEKLRDWLFNDTGHEGFSNAIGVASTSPLVTMLGHSPDYNYVIVPVDNGFALISRRLHDVALSFGPAKDPERVSITFCSSAEELSQTVIAKMAQHKLTAR